MNKCIANISTLNTPNILWGGDLACISSSFAITLADETTE